MKGTSDEKTVVAWRRVDILLSPHFQLLILDGVVDGRMDMSSRRDCFRSLGSV